MTPGGSAHDRCFLVDLDPRETGRGGRFECRFGRVGLGEQLERTVVAGAFERVENGGVEPAPRRAVQRGRGRERAQQRRRHGDARARVGVEPRQLTRAAEAAPALFESFELRHRPFREPVGRVANDDARRAPHGAHAPFNPVVGELIQGHFDPLQCGGGGGGGGGGTNIVVGGVALGVVTCRWVGGGATTGGGIVCTGGVVATGAVASAGGGAVGCAGAAAAAGCGAAGAVAATECFGALVTGGPAPFGDVVVVDETCERRASVPVVAAVVLDVGAPGTGA